MFSTDQTLKEFHNMLLGCKELHIHTNHKNNAFMNLNFQRIICWYLFLEEYNPIFHYIKGSHNTLADTLSQLPWVELQSDCAVLQPSSPNMITTPTSGVLNPLEDQFNHCFSIMLDDDALAQCFLNFPEVSPDQPFCIRLCYHHQWSATWSCATANHSWTASPISAHTNGSKHLTHLPSSGCQTLAHLHPQCTIRHHHQFQSSVDEPSRDDPNVWNNFTTFHQSAT